jgi:hypothetical protein
MPGMYVYMDARRWYWIKPIPLRGFQGYHYVPYTRDAWPIFSGQAHPIDIVGGWRDPRPEVSRG